MDAARINAKIYSGRGKAALRLGLSFDVHRPVSAAVPLPLKRATIKAAFNAGDNTYIKPNMPGDAYWHGDFDGTKTQQGDYLVGVDTVYFVAGMQPLLPILCVECNHRVLVIRQIPVTAVGEVGYGGVVPANDEIILGADGALWPASMLIFGSRNEALNLPADAREAGLRCCLPPSVPIQIIPGYIIKDENGRRYLVEAAELTDLGWRLNMTEKHA